jgi:hypothetical protein
MLSQLITFSADKLDGFIITNSLVGLGLVIAIYALMSPVLKELFNKRKAELVKLRKERDEKFKKMSNSKEDTNLTNEYKNIQNEIKRFLKLPLHLDRGYQITTVIFTYTILISSMRLCLDPLKVTETVFNQLGQISFLLLIGGIFIFAFFFLSLLFEIRDYNFTEFQKILEEEEKSEKEKNIK